MEQMGRLSIDFKAAQLFFNLVKQSKGVLGCQNYITTLVDKLSEQVPFDREFPNDMKLAMVTRGLLLTLSHTDFSSVSWQPVTMQCLKLFAQVTEQSKNVALVVAHQPKLVLIDLITQLQDLLTNMVLFSGG